MVEAVPASHPKSKKHQQKSKASLSNANSASPSVPEANDGWTRYREQRRPSLLKLVLALFIAWVVFLIIMIRAR